MSESAHIVHHLSKHGAPQAIKAWRSGATILGGLGAGATAAVGGPAVVAAAAAVAPFVIGAAVVGGVGVGVYSLFKKLTD
jgi:hypothetical protein